MKTILIAGLGNPGKKYLNNRHNVGHMFMNFLIDKMAGSQVSGLKLAKTDDFMNLSGVFVKKLVRNSGSDPKNLIIVHDDLDIPLGKLRIKEEGSSAGHNGIESVIQVLGTRKFIRVRIGIEKTNKKIPSEKYVLQKIKSLENLLNAKKAAEAVLAIVKNGVGKAMTEYNRVKN